ncbi:hypothetical protein CEXT_22841 [Caerostris extrusa]|uniref:Uncharacterized protein n=1 Tax=Caerostris extrusa TaxID=172846 RepID=A0AAV4VBG7_CAEEX|nr:hypothetical protein CEXT_22841 [Caerostris extrusa]
MRKRNAPVCHSIVFREEWRIDSVPVPDIRWTEKSVFFRHRIITIQEQGKAASPIQSRKRPVNGPAVMERGHPCGSPRLSRKFIGEKKKKSSAYGKRSVHEGEEEKWYAYTSFSVGAAASTNVSVSFTADIV